MESIYRKPINTISWDDIEQFCQQGSTEGHLLDYKRDIPERLPNTIAAMANTWGGLILIGVEEDRKTNKAKQVLGIPLDPGIIDRVTNIDLDSITPPVIPEIGLAVHPNGNKAVVIVRVHQSHQTPHAIDHNTTVYIRTGNRNSQYGYDQPATLEKIAWLLDGRRKSEELLKSLYDRAEERFDKIRSLAATKYPNVKNGAATMTLSVAPLFPKEAYKTPPEIRPVLTSIRVRAGEEFFGKMFPAANEYTMVQDGFLVHQSSEDGGFCHTELNTFGLFFYKQTLISVNRGFSIDSTQIFSRLEEFFDSAELFYKAIGYNGPLHFRVMLQRVSPWKLLQYVRQGNGLGLSGEYRCVDPEISHQDIVLAHLLKEKKADLIQNAVDRIGWGFNWNITPAVLSEYFDFTSLRRRP